MLVAELPARETLVKTRVHPDPKSDLPTGNALVMFPYYAPGATGSSQDASEELLQQLQRVSVASNATVIAVLVLFVSSHIVFLESDTETYVLLALCYAFVWY